MPLRALWLASCLVCLALPAVATAQSCGTQAEALLDAGDFAGAVSVMTGLVAQAPDDACLLVQLGRAQIAAGQAQGARDTARRAWRAARGLPELRFNAARLGARAAADTEHYGAARFWLRLAADVAQTPAEVQAIDESFAALDQRDRSETRLSFALAPSSNINGGSSAERLIVDGISTPLILSGDARALSGIQGRLDLTHKWRLASSPRGSTFLGLRFTGTSYALSDAAQVQAPDLEGKDLGSALIELSLARRIPVSQGSLTFQAAAGQLWYGGQRSAVRLRFDASLQRRFSPVLSGTFSALIEGRDSNRGPVQSLAVSFSGGLERQFVAGRLEADLTLTRLFSPERRSEAYLGALARVQFAPRLNNRIMEPTLALTASINHFDTALGNIFGNDGRTDKRLALDLRLDLPKAARFGFVPSVTLSGGRTWSNISRFDGTEFSATLGVSSRF